MWSTLVIECFNIQMQSILAKFNIFIPIWLIWYEYWFWLTHSRPNFFLIREMSHDKGSLFRSLYDWPVYFIRKLIHEANPQSRPVGIIIFTHIVRSYVRSSSPLLKQNKCQAKAIFDTGETVGLAEWIIDDTCVLLLMGFSCYIEQAWQMSINLSLWTSSIVDIY